MKDPSMDDRERIRAGRGASTAAPKRMYGTPVFQFSFKSGKNDPWF